MSLHATEKTLDTFLYSVYWICTSYNCKRTCFAAIDFTFRHEMRYKLFIYLFICAQCFQSAESHESAYRIIGRETKWNEMKKENESGDSKETKHKLITINNHTLETTSNTYDNRDTHTARQSKKRVTVFVEESKWDRNLIYIKAYEL